MLAERPKLIRHLLCECGQTCATAASDNTLYLSTDGDAELGGLSFLNRDLVEYDRSADSATLFLDGTAAGMSTTIDALHVLDNGHLIISTAGGTTFGGLTFENYDLVKYDPDAGTATMFFEGDAHFSSSKNIISVHILDNGNIVLSTDGGTTLGGVAYSLYDLIEYNPTTGNASIFFDGDATTLAKKITALQIRDDGQHHINSGWRHDARWSEFRPGSTRRLRPGSRYGDTVFRR